MEDNNIQERIVERVYRCYHCHNALGICSDTTLIIGAAKFMRSITIGCGFCGRTTFFKPDKSTQGQYTQRLDKF